MTNIIEKLNNRKTFMNQSQLYRFNRWNKDENNLRFFYFRSKWTISYEDSLGVRYNTNFRWHNANDKLYILENNDGFLVKKYATDDLDYINKRCYTYNKIVSLFNKRDGNDLKLIYNSHIKSNETSQRF